MVMRRGRGGGEGAAERGESAAAVVASAEAEHFLEIVF